MLVEDLDTVNAAKIYLKTDSLSHRMYFTNLAAAVLLTGNSEKIRGTLDKLVEIRQERKNIVPFFFREVVSVFTNYLSSNQECPD